MTVVRTLVRSAVVLVVVATVGCESSTEVAGIGTATAKRETDGTVTVTATLKCELVYGMPGNGKECGGDDEEACVVAEWFDANDTAFAHAIASAQTCEDVEHVVGRTIVVRTSTALPTTPLKIRVMTTPELGEHDSHPVPVIIDSP